MLMSLLRSCSIFLVASKTLLHLPRIDGTLPLNQEDETSCVSASLSSAGKDSSQCRRNSEDRLVAFFLSYKLYILYPMKVAIRGEALG